MVSLAEMDRELTIERTRAGLDVARQLGRKGGRKRQMTESKIKSAKKLLANGVPARDVASNLGASVPNPLPLDSRLRPKLSVLCCPFSDGTPFTTMLMSCGAMPATARDAGRRSCVAQILQFGSNLVAETGLDQHDLPPVRTTTQFRPSITRYNSSGSIFSDHIALGTTPNMASPSKRQVRSVQMVISSSPTCARPRMSSSSIAIQSIAIASSVSPL